VLRGWSGRCFRILAARAGDGETRHVHQVAPQRHPAWQLGPNCGQLSAFWDSALAVLARIIASASCAAWG